MLLFHFVGAGSCFQRFPKVIWFAMLFEVVGFVLLQFSYLRMSACNVLVPLEYYWLSANVLLFFLVVIYVISMWAHFLCWVADEE